MAPARRSEAYPRQLDIREAISTEAFIQPRENDMKVYSGAPHGTCPTERDKVNADLPEFIRS